MVHKHTRNLGDAFFLGGNKTTMTSNNVKTMVITIGKKMFCEKKKRSTKSASMILTDATTLNAVMNVLRFISAMPVP